MTLITDALLSLVIPLYNEEENVALLTQKIHESLGGYHYQIIYIDDCSQDGTRAGWSSAAARRSPAARATSSSRPPSRPASMSST